MAIWRARWSERLRRYWTTFRTSYARWAVSASMAAVVALGVVLRSRGYIDSTLPLWLDEADWAVMLLNLPLSEHLIRPLGFMAVCKAAAAVFSPTETALRLFPWFAGVGTALLAPFAAFRLFKSAVSRLLFVAIIALHPAAIDLSREFKPYTVSLAVHVLLPFVVLRYVATRRSRDLAVALALLVPAVLFAQDVVFAYPALFLVLAIEALRGRRFRHLTGIVAGGLASIAIVLTLYLMVWSKLESGEADYWGKKYDVFNVEGKSKHDYADWALGKYTEMTQVPGLRREFWASAHVSKSDRAELREIDGVLWSVLHALGILVIALQRRWREALLLVSPLVVMLVFNRLGFWPFGVFRTNLFIVAYFAAIAAMALDPGKRRPVTLHALLPATLLVAVPLFLFEEGWHARKRYFASYSEMPTLVARIGDIHAARSRSKEPELLVLDNHSCPTWKYYTQYHPTYSTLYAPDLRQRFDVHCDELDKNGGKWVRRHLAEGHGRAWILFTGSKAHRRAMKGYLRGARMRRTKISGHWLIEVRKLRK